MPSKLVPLLQPCLEIRKQAEEILKLQYTFRGVLCTSDVARTVKTVDT